MLFRSPTSWKRGLHLPALGSVILVSRMSEVTCQRAPGVGRRAGCHGCVWLEVLPDELIRGAPPANAGWLGGWGLAPTGPSRVSEEILAQRGPSLASAFRSLLPRRAILSQWVYCEKEVKSKMSALLEDKKNGLDRHAERQP